MPDKIGLIEFHALNDSARTRRLVFYQQAMHIGCSVHGAGELMS